MNERQCTKCNTIKELECFRTKKRKLKLGNYTCYLSSECKSCENKRKYNSRKRNPESYEKLKERARKRAKNQSLKFPGKGLLRGKKFVNDRKEDGTWKNLWLQAKYGITLDIYNEMLKEQNYSCKICKRNKDNFKRPLHVDHCHTTGKVRGLLCSNCNSVLGHSKDSVETLLGAIEYLRLVA